MTELNEEQIQAANFLNGVCLTVAIPGSGKTLVMTERIAILVNKHGVSPENILGLTFTRNAAQSMRDKLTPVLNDLASRVMLSTFHSFCHFLLRNEGRRFTMLKENEQIGLIRQIMKKQRVKDLSLGMVLREISLAKNNLITVEEFQVLHEDDKTMKKVADIYQAYEIEKGKALTLDFDDLLLETHKLLSEKEEVREKYQEIIRHLLVDEFQDTNPVQLEILKLLVDRGSGETSFWVCGDELQSIYSFIGASIGNILNFETLFPQSERFILNLNYRSTPQIIKACSNLIHHNVRKIEKQLKAVKPDGENVMVLESSTEEDEAISLVCEIMDLVERKGFAYKDIVVIYRANFQSRTIEETFSQNKIPYHIENGLGFYHRREVKGLLDYLRLIAYTDSEIGNEALKSIINLPNRYLGKKFITELEEFAEDRGIHLYQALKSLPIDLPYLRKNVKKLVELMDNLIQDRDKLSPAETIYLLRAVLDYDRAVTDEDVPAPDDLKIQNLDQLQLSAARFSTIHDFLKYADSFEDLQVSSKEGVGLMTIHKAKGLEFKVVFLIGMVEGMLPSKKGDIEEERRICFVAISRAMQILYLSYSKVYMGVPAIKSLFIDEIMGSEN